MKINDLFRSDRNNESGPIRPYIIAEAGVNHEGSVEVARRLIREAKEGGADAIKFQTYKAERLASRNSPSYWDLKQEPTTSQYALFQKYDVFDEDDYRELKKYCTAVDIEFLSTPFDIESAGFLNDLMDVFKISSSDITNKPFIEYICSFQKPILLSTGASSLKEVTEAKKWVENTGNPLALLHCVLNYPTADNHAHLGRIIELKKAFPDIIIGYSDHTLPGSMRVLEIATILGARILEKHFTHDKTLPGNDHYHAMDREDLKRFCTNLKWVFQVLGDYTTSYDPNEEPARKNARRSLVARRDIPKGARITSEDITWKRPADGISPKYLDELIGKKSGQDIREDDILLWGMFQE